MEYQLLATLVAYLSLLGLIFLTGLSSDENTRVHEHQHVLRIAVRLAIVFIITATPCILLGAHPLLIIGLMLFLPLAAYPLAPTGIGLPVLLLYSWITMKPGTTVAALFTHNNEEPKPANPLQRPELKSQWLGKKGVTSTVLRPHGKITIDGESLEAKAQFGLIQAGAAICVVQQEDGTLIVEEATDQ